MTKNSNHQTTVEAAGEISGIRWRLKTVRAPRETVEPAKQCGHRVSLGVARTFASATEQKAYWVNLIAKAQPTKIIK
jgi:hypothetical protein